MLVRLVWFVIHVYRAGWEYGMKFLKKCLEDRRVRFALVGFFATVVYFALGVLFVNILGWYLLIGNTLAYALSFVASYLGQSKWTFEVQGDHRKMLFKFAMTQLAGLGLNTLLVTMLTSMGVYYPIAMLAAICLVPVFVYLTCRYWVFKKSAKEESDG